jgi:hypothetical protein
MILFEFGVGGYDGSFFRAALEVAMWSFFSLPTL